jgi:tetratricopeptide (TPR) repeat protein
MAQDRADEAGKHFDIAEQLFGMTPEPVDVANLHTDQARRAVHLGDGDEAVRRARAAVEAAGDEYPHEKGNALWMLAEGQALSGDVDSAHASFRQATSMLEEQGHRRDFIEAYRAWGKFLRRVGREDEALEVLERAADLAAEPVASDPRSRR